MRHNSRDLFDSLAVLVAAAMLFPFEARSAVPPGFVNQPYASGFTVPVGVTFDPPTGRMLVIEKRGKVWVHHNNVTLPVPFIDLMDEVHDAGDKGLLGITLDPDFSTNHYVYLLYAVDPIFGQPDEPEDAIVFGRLTRYTATGNVADLGSRLVLLGSTALEGHPGCSVTHSIGSVKFGFDGSLFVGAGDGAHPGFVDGGQNVLPNDPLCEATFGSAQDVGALRSQIMVSMDGKILRIDPATGFGLPDNPFWDGDPNSVSSRIWVKGLRNPYRFNLRPGSPSPGTIYIGDVGWMRWEEINVAYGGENFGWPCWEGVGTQEHYYTNALTGPTCQGIPPESVSPPLITYHHTNPNPIGFIGNCASGVTFYTGTSYPSEYWNRCFFADYGQSWIRVAEVNDQDQLISIQPFGTTMNLPIDLQSHPDNGDLVYIAIPEGRVRRIRYTIGNFPPIVFASANPTEGNPPLVVQFSSDGSYDPNTGPLTFTWSFGDGSPNTNTPNPVHTYTTEGTFEARLIATDVEALADTAYVTIVSSNEAPSVTITNPPNGFVFTSGEPIPLSANASDPEDGTNVSYAWSVSLIHNNHIHPGWFSSDEPSPVFVPTDHGADEDRMSFRIAVLVTDPDGAATGDSVLIVPDDLGPNANPVAQVSADLYEGAAPLTVTFDATSSVDPDSDLLEFAWDFGDGTTGSGPAPAHTFGAFGLYRVNVHVFDPFLGADSTSCAVRVEPGGILASWNFDEGSGTFVRDLSGNDRDGALLGNGFTWVQGMRGNGIDFNGSESLMTTGQSFLSNRSAFTLVAWARPHTAAALQGIVGQYGAIGIGLDTPAALQVSTANGGQIAAPYTFPMNEWHHVASVGTGTSLIAYTDGAVANVGGTQTVNYGSSSDPVNVAGNVFGTSGESFDGTVDDIRIYDSALSPEAIAFFATPTPPNASPSVDAGLDLTADVGVSTALLGQVVDDGYPAPPGKVTVLWSQISGPASASLFNPDRLYTLAQFPAPGEYQLRLTANDGELSGTDDVQITVGGPTDVSGAGAIVEGLHRILPNPMRGKTTIEYGVAHDGAHVRLSIHDVAGRRVTKIAEDAKRRGNYRAIWDGRNERGAPAASAIYFAVLDVESRRFTRKIVVAR